MVFLPSSPSNQDRLSAQPPVIRADEPEFLIEASNAYPRLEGLTLDARHSIWFAYRIFDPETRLHSPRSYALGLETWGDLIAHKLDQGVTFRLLLTDFDPIVGDTLHEDTWRAMTALYRRKQASDKPWDMHVCPAQHEAKAGRYIRMVLAPAIYARINAKRRALNALPPSEREESFQYLRGYHRYLHLSRAGQVVWRPKLVLPHIYPVTHHHKLAVFDGETAVLGGLDVNDRRYDDPTHDRDSGETWHDMNMRITGATASHVARYIAGIWNADRRDATRRMKRARRQCPDLFDCLARTLPTLERPARNTAPSGTVPMQVLRTLSRRRGMFGFRLRPETVDHGIEDAHIALVRGAKTLLYIETQFFRHRPLAEALAERARECPGLRLVMLLPAAPEEIAFDDRNGLDSRYGERLQADCIDSFRIAGAASR